MTPNEEIRVSLFLLGFKDVKTSNTWKMVKGETSVEDIEYILYVHYKVLQGGSETLEYMTETQLINWLNNEENL